MSKLPALETKIANAKLADAKACSRIKHEARLITYGGLGLKRETLGQMAQHNASTIAKCRSLIKEANEKPKLKHFIVAEEKSDVIGFARAKKLPDGTAQIVWLFVDPRRQSRGVGSALLENCLDWAEGHKVALKVLRNNQRAISLYKKKGFKLTGIVPPSRLGLKQEWMEREKIYHGKT